MNEWHGVTSQKTWILNATTRSYNKKSRNFGGWKRESYVVGSYSVLVRSSFWWKCYENGDMRVRNGGLKLVSRNYFWIIKVRNLWRKRFFVLSQGGLMFMNLKEGGFMRRLQQQSGTWNYLSIFFEGWGKSSKTISRCQLKTDFYLNNI